LECKTWGRPYCKTVVAWATNYCMVGLAAPRAASSVVSVRMGREEGNNDKDKEEDMSDPHVVSDREVEESHMGVGGMADWTAVVLNFLERESFSTKVAEYTGVEGTEPWDTGVCSRDTGMDTETDSLGRKDD
jgi:hypothetical protein